MKRKFEFLEHTADVKIRVYGKSIEKVFENSAYALRKIIIKGKRIKKDKKEGDNLRKERYKIKKRKIKVFGKDYLSLLYNFLEEIIYLVDAENFLVKKIDKINLKIAFEYFDESVLQHVFGFHGIVGITQAYAHHLTGISFKQYMLATGMLLDTSLDKFRFCHLQVGLGLTSC